MISQTPTAGTKAKKGDTVTLTYGKLQEASSTAPESTTAPSGTETTP